MKRFSRLIGLLAVCTILLQAQQSYVPQVRMVAVDPSGNFKLLNVDSSGALAANGNGTNYKADSGYVPQVQPVAMGPDGQFHVLLVDNTGALKTTSNSSSGASADTRPMQTTTVKGVAVNPGQTYTFSTSPTSPSAAGTITNFHFTLGANGGVDGMTIAQTSFISINCDGQTETFPVGMFFAGMDAPLPFWSDWIGNQVGNANNQNNSMNRRVEINYSTGCTLSYTNASFAGQALVFADIQYRVGPNVSRSSRQHWHAYYTSTTPVAAYASFAALPTITAAGGGELDSDYLFVSDTNSYFAEASETVTADGAVSVQANGLEDFFGCGWYCVNGKGGFNTSKWGDFYASNVGASPSLQTPAAASDMMFYRLFTTSDGDNVLFTNSLGLTWANGVNGAAPTPNTAYTQSLVSWWTHDAMTAPVMYSPAGAQLSLPATVTLSTATSGATICYTTDGTAPVGDGAGGCTHGTSGSSVSVSSAETVSAIATKSGFADGKITSASYGAAASLGYITGSYASNGSSMASSVTSGSITFNAGDHAVIYCRTNLDSASVASAWTATSSVLTNLVRLGGTINPTNAMEAMYEVDQMPAGAVTFSCATPGVNYDYMDIVVLDYAAGSTHYYNATGGNIGGSTNTPTTGTFSTSSPGLIVACFNPEYGTSFTAGAIGGSAATLRLSGSNGAGCEDIITTGAKTNITATFNAADAGQWGYGVATFQ